MDAPRPGLHGACRWAPRTPAEASYGSVQGCGVSGDAGGPHAPGQASLAGGRRSGTGQRSVPGRASPPALRPEHSPHMHEWMHVWMGGGMCAGPRARGGGPSRPPFVSCRAPSRCRWRCRSASDWPSATSSLFRQRSRSRHGRCCPSLSAPLQVWPGCREKRGGRARQAGTPGQCLEVGPLPGSTFRVPKAAGHRLLEPPYCPPAGLVLEPLPVGAWAFLGVTATILTRTLSFAQAFTAFTNDAIWLIVVSFFFAKAGWRRSWGVEKIAGGGGWLQGMDAAPPGWANPFPPRTPRACMWGARLASALSPSPLSPSPKLPRRAGLPENGSGSAGGHHLRQVLW